MPSVTYTAKRRVISGHTAGVSYSVDFDADVLQPNFPQKVDHVEALDGSRDTLLWNVRETWSVTVTAIAAAQLNAWLEFLQSVVGGESFTFDPYGTAAAPVSPLTVELEGEFSTPRHGETMYFNPAFSVRVL